MMMLELLIGQLAYLGCFKRPLLAILCHIFRQSSPDGARDIISGLHSWARNELVCLLAFLLPLAVTNLRIGFTDTLFGADASLDAAGGTKVRVSTSLVQELWRRAPRKGGVDLFWTHRAQRYTVVAYAMPMMARVRFSWTRRVRVRLATLWM